MNASAVLYSLAGRSMLDHGVVQRTSTDPHALTFTYCVSLQGERFYGTARNKKDAKNCACKAALAKLRPGRAMRKRSRSSGDDDAPDGSKQQGSSPKRRYVGVAVAYSTTGIKDQHDFQERYDKSALSVLNELCNDRHLEREFEDSSRRGPVHEPVYKVILRLRLQSGEERTFEGYGTKKQTARQDAAFKALCVVLEEGILHEGPGRSADIRTDQLPQADMSSEVQSPPPSLIKEVPQIPSAMQKLNEFNPGLEYVAVQDTASGLFRTTVTISGMIFSGEAATKKEACHAAASKALLQMYGFDLGAYTQHLQRLTSVQNGYSDTESCIAELSMAKYAQLEALVPQDARGRDNVAAFLMHRRDKWEVVAIATGVQLNKEFRPCEGQSLHDCHAEVLARRSFVRFLVRQVDLCARLRDENADDSVNGTDPSFVDSCVFSMDAGGRLRLKAAVEFHLFLKAAPCGDACITEGLSTGCLRYKVSCLIF